MSEENVEVVRAYYERMDRALATYWADPTTSIDDVPGAADVFESLHEDIEWKPTFTPERFRGRDGVRQAMDDWLEASEDWRLTVEDLRDAGGDRVFGTVKVHMRGKGSGVAVDQRAFMVFAVRDRKVALVEGYVDRDEALEAAGLPE